MPFEVVKIVNEERTIIFAAGDTVVRTIPFGEVVRASPDSGGPEYIRFQLKDSRSWKWNAPVADWNESVGDPTTEARWVRE